MHAQIESLFVGTTQILNRLYKSSINKRATDVIEVSKDALFGDEVTNKLHHGGSQRVLHYYPREHYSFLISIFNHDDLFVPGSMGENLSASGWNEENVCIGDLFKIGDVVCQVTEPRKPCLTINLKFSQNTLARELQNQAMTGWFFKIIRPGSIHVGDSIILLERKYPLLVLKKCVQALLVRPDFDHLKLMIENPVLSSNWKLPIPKILESGVLPDDRARLGEIVVGQIPT